VGFESSRVARRRLAALASSNNVVQEALAPSTFPGFLELNDSPTDASNDLFGGCVAAPNDSSLALDRQLDALARDILRTPGAGSALLAAYAAQARALTLVLEATRRSGDGPLPEAVVSAARDALASSRVLSGVALA
jgi:hypothetical protein